MTTIIYFFLMGLSLFILPQLVVRVLTKEVKIDSNLIYLVFAFLLPICWVLLPKEVVTVRQVNFIQHAVGGGFSVGLVGIYLINSLKNHFVLLKKFPVQILFVYFLVSGLGVANEMLEFLLDSTGVGIFSADRYDTWFDLLANTIGALSMYMLYKSLNLRNYENHQ